MTPDSVIWTTSGYYYDTIRTAEGCDSIYAEIFTVVNVDTSVNLNENTLSANISDASYKWLDCTSDFSQIEGETQQSFTPSIAGSFAVEITVNSCKDTSSCYSLDPTVGFEGTSGKQIMTWWDSRSDRVRVDLAAEYKEIQVQVFDIQGRLIHTTNMQSVREFQFALEQPSGIYFIHLTSREYVATRKIVKR
jgi:hypothetical protein